MGPNSYVSEAFFILLQDDIYGQLPISQSYCPKMASKASWVGSKMAKRRNFDGIFSTGAFSFSMDFFRQKNDGKITTEKFRHLKK